MHLASGGGSIHCYNLAMKLQTSSIVRNVDVDGPRSITSFNPATEEEIATVSALDQGGAVDAVEAAKEAFPGWSHTPVKERQKIIARWLEIMLEERDELAQLVSMEGGKPVNEARLVDVFPGLESLSYYSKHLDEMLAFRTGEAESDPVRALAGGLSIRSARRDRDHYSVELPGRHSDGRNRARGWCRQHGGLQTGLGDRADRS